MKDASHPSFLSIYTSFLFLKEEFALSITPMLWQSLGCPVKIDASIASPMEMLKGRLFVFPFLSSPKKLRRTLNGTHLNAKQKCNANIHNLLYLLLDIEGRIQPHSYSQKKITYWYIIAFR